MLKVACSLVVLLSAFLQAADDQYIASSSRTRRASGHSHFDAASAELAEKKRIKFRLGSGTSNKIAKLGRKAFGNQTAALLLTMPSDTDANAKRFKKKKDKAIEIETIALTDEARKPPFLEEEAYDPLNNKISTQED